MRIAVIVGFVAGLGFASGVSSQQAALDCSLGPLARTYGSTQWLVYACSDEKSVVFVTPSESPAAPFYFMLTPKDGKYTLVGEGAGSKAYTDRAYAELAKLTATDVGALIRAAKAQGSTQK